MQKTIEQIEALIAENRAVPVEDRTGALDVALGGLNTAREMYIDHVRVKEWQAAALKQPTIIAPAIEN